jgi:hypothetical protein
MVGPRGVRIPITIEAVVIKGDRRCESVIENFSEEGIYLKVFREENIDFSCGKTINVEFKTATGEIVNVHCEIMRSEMPDSKSIEYFLGLKLVDVTQEYEEFFKTLYMKEMGMF